MNVKIYPALIFVLLLVRSSEGECCRGVECPGVPWGKQGCCADGITRDNNILVGLGIVGGNFCCGNGRCKVFCCNCDGGCRQGHLRSNSNIFDPGFWTPELVSGFGEALTGRKKRSTEEIARDLDHFSSFDINGDGFINANEIIESFGKVVDNFIMFDGVAIPKLLFR